jgi:hypothetical protein
MKRIKNQHRRRHLACSGVAGLACLVRSVAARGTALVGQLASCLVGLPPSLADAICCCVACLLRALLRL